MLSERSLLRETVNGNLYKNPVSCVLESFTLIACYVVTFHNLLTSVDTINDRLTVTSY